jgi:hypothetical protein
MVSARWPGWPALVLVALAGPAMAQERPPPRVELRENYPNPFFPSTTIPFTIHPQLCERGHQPLVSLKIYNVLVQEVGVPILLNSNGERLDNLRLRCGAHEAYWDGRATGNRDPSPGVYYAQLTVDGERFTLRMIARR